MKAEEYDYCFMGKFSDESEYTGLPYIFNLGIFDLRCEFAKIFRKFMAIANENEAYYFPLCAGLRLLQVAKDYACEGESVEQTICVEAKKILRYCKRGIFFQRKYPKDPELNLDCVTAEYLLGALYAIYELDEGKKYLLNERLNPFCWYFDAIDFLNWIDPSVKKAGRKRLADSQEKMCVVAEVIAQNPKAPDKKLLALIGLKKNLAATTQREWLNAFRSLPEEEQQRYIEQVQQK